MRKLRILAIDDDPLQAELLRSHIDDLGHLLIEVCTEVAEFKRLFLATQPELLIVDIDLKSDITGIELVRNLENQPPTIFLTGVKDQDTIQKAVHSDAIAYISKPYTETDLFAGISIAEKDLTKDLIPPNEEHSSKSPSCLYIKQGQYLVKVDFKDILWIEVQEKNCIIHTQQKDYNLNTRLKELLANLPSDFLQIHRSYVINSACLEKVDLKLMRVIVSSRDLPIGRHYKNSILSKINTFS